MGVIRMSSPFRSRAFSLPRVRTMAAAGATLALLGCAVGPDFKRPEAPATKDYVAGGVEQPKVTAGKEAPQQFTMGKKISGDWWHLFRSPALDDVLKTALAQNQSLAAATATLAQAQQNIAQASGALWPQVDFAASARRPWRMSRCSSSTPLTSPSPAAR